jgi:hypothetical protein
MSRKTTHEAASMPLHDQWVVARFETFGDEDGDLDLMVADLLVESCVDVETVEAGFGSGLRAW